MKVTAAVSFSFGECGGPDTALCSPALPAAFALSIVFWAAGKAGEQKRCQGHRTPKEEPTAGRTLQPAKHVTGTHYPATLNFPPA